MHYFHGKAANVMLEVHQLTLGKIMARLEEGFADASLQSMIDLTEEVEELNDTLPDKAPHTLRIKDIALAAYYQAAVKKHGPILANQL